MWMGGVGCGANAANNLAGANGRANRQTVDYATVLSSIYTMGLPESPFDALRPLASRLPAVVREHEVLRIGAALMGDRSAAADKARQEVLKWAQRRSGGRLPSEAWDGVPFEYLSGGRNSVCTRVQSPSLDIWAIRADDPDKEVAGRIWSTEVVVAVYGDDQPRFTCRSIVSTAEREPEFAPHAPGLVQQVAEACGLFSGPSVLSAVPRQITSELDFDDFVSHLESRNRRLPVLVSTISDGETEPSIDVDRLARAVIGLADVYILPPEFAWKLTERYGRHRSVFGGAIRQYMPGFGPDTNPYEHKLVLAERIVPGMGSEDVSAIFRRSAASWSLRSLRLGAEVLRFSDIRSASLKLVQQRLVSEGASAPEQLQAANERIAAMEAQAQDAAASLEYFSEEHARAEARAQAAEQQLRSSVFRIQQLVEQVRASGGQVDQNDSYPASWEDFAEWCDVQLAGRVVLTPHARRSVRSPLYEDVRTAAECLLWLGNEARTRRLDGGDGPVAEESVRSGIRNSLCGSDEFSFDWQGNRLRADWHIKSGGNTRDPRRCLRIYYAWDPTSLQMIVADMPAHRDNDAS